MCYRVSDSDGTTQYETLEVALNDYQARLGSIIERRVNGAWESIPEFALQTYVSKPHMVVYDEILDEVLESDTAVRYNGHMYLIEKDRLAS